MAKLIHISIRRNLYYIINLLIHYYLRKVDLIIINTKFQFNDSDSEIPVKKYKNEISNKIKNLNNEQKKGLFSIVSNDCIDKNMQDNVMEINVNKMTFNQLKQLDKYINRCIKDNKSGLSSPREKIIELKRSRLLENEKESEILKNDDLSSCLSDDEDDDEDE